MSHDDYEVGYGKPPKATQFKKGQSGNPKGRPKGVQNLATDLQDELSAKVEITEDGQTKKVTKQKAMVKQLMQKAIKGDPKSIDVVFKHYLTMELAKIRDDKEAEPSSEDKAIIEAFLKEHAEKDNE
ncbi:MAG: DUF5681 domain-containing protein [Pseudohongiellaceae bacterium]